MKQLTSAEWMANLSPTAKERLHAWMKIKGYGMELDGEFFPLTQLAIGHLIEFLSDSGSMSISLWDEGWQLTVGEKTHDPMFVPELLDALCSAVTEILNEKN